MFSVKLIPVLLAITVTHIVNASFPAFQPMRRELVGESILQYLQAMCMPSLSNETLVSDLNTTEWYNYLANSPFPCERSTYFVSACGANDTSAIDFIAEQQCLCNGGAMWDLMNACNDCYVAHGDPRDPAGSDSSFVASLKTAECSNTQPCQPFSMLLPSRVDPAGASERWASRTLAHDRFPNDTAVSNYFTPTRSITLGKITGSATARMTTWNTDPNVVPTCTNSAGPGPTPSSGTGSSSSYSISASASGNGAVGTISEVHVRHVAVAVVLGAAVLL